MQTSLYSKITDALVNEGYIVITNALDTELSKKLKQFAQNEPNFKRAGISGKGDLHLDNDRRRDKIHWLEEDGAAQSDFLSFADGVELIYIDPSELKHLKNNLFQEPNNVNNRIELLETVLKGHK